MKDIIEQLETAKRSPMVEFCRLQDSAKLPEPVNGISYLYSLYPIQNYRISLTEAEYTSVDTGIAIKSAASVELTAILPEDIYDQNTITKQTEVLINPSYRGSIRFLASELFGVQLHRNPDDLIYLYTSDPFCFLKITPVQNADVGGLKNG